MEFRDFRLELITDVAKDVNDVRHFDFAAKGPMLIID